MTANASFEPTANGEPASAAPLKRYRHMQHSTVVVDKSFLQGLKTAEMHAFASTHRLLMSEALLYELLSNPVDRASCFAKFQNVDNPVDLVMHVGGYLRKEVDRRKPAPRPSDTVQKIRFQFNSRLLDDDYKLPPQAALAMEQQRDDLLNDVKSLKERALLVPSFFPDAFAGSDKRRRAARAEAERIIAGETGSLLDFYGQLRSPRGHRRLPPKRIVNDQWALYRWLQVHFLFSIDLYWRYGEQLAEPLSPTAEEKIEHDVLDAQYMFIGVLEGSFATHEKKLRRWFTAIRPDGALFGKDG